MARRLLRRNNQLPYHVTARANNREAFPLDLWRLWEIFGEEGLALHILFGAEVHALVLMPNHFHLLVTVPEGDLGKAMNSLMRSVAQRTNLRTGRSGHVFGGPYRWSLIGSTCYFRHALKYVYRNPVKAGLCSVVEEYPFSTLYGLLGNAHLPFPISFTRVGMELALPHENPIEQLGWLNRPFPQEAEKLIQAGLRKARFEALKNRQTRRPHVILNTLI
jgi:putative transposase